jgi:C4-dicarboxylate transporter DctM subunit
MIIVSASTFLGWALAYERIPQQIAQIILVTVTNPIILILLIICLLLFAGTFLHGAPLLLIIVPLFMPTLIMANIDLIYFGIIVVICVGIGQQTPPVGSALYVASAISGDDILSVSKAGIPFTLVILAVLLLIVFVPDVAMYLPRLVVR